MRKACLLGHVSEGSVPVVVVKRIAIDAGDKDVVIAVIVVVADGHAYIEAGPFQARLLRYVGEASVAVVVEEAVPVFWRVFLERLDISPIGKEDVGPTVAIVIE